MHTPVHARPALGAAVLAAGACGIVSAAVAQAPVLTNPAVGPPTAPATLEYFSAVGCDACERFEVHGLPALLAEAEAGRLRIVFRDVPPAEPAWVDWARTVFCQQEQASYLAARRVTKTMGPKAAPMAAPESAPERADRYGRCLATPGVPSILAFNAAALAATGLPGLPGFVWRDGRGRQDAWSGYRDRPPRTGHAASPVPSQPDAVSETAHGAGLPEEPGTAARASGTGR